MRCACIDIGSNTTRVLVAEVRDGALTEVLARRAFTRLGRHLRAGVELAPEKIAEIAAVVAEHHALAVDSGAEVVRAVATAAIRGAAGREELVAAIREQAGVAVHVLDGVEEARLAFLGATATLPEPPPGSVAVVDVGGGSTEIAAGSMRDGVMWSASYALGSGVLADAHLRADPPAPGELRSMRDRVLAELAAVHVPRPDLAVAVGGSATSMRRLVGDVIDADSVARGLRILTAAPSRRVAEEHGLDPERVRLLPAGLVLLAECAGVLGVPLRVGRGGLREGVCLELGSPDA